MKSQNHHKKSQSITLKSQEKHHKIPLKSPNHHRNHQEITHGTSSEAPRCAPAPPAAAAAPARLKGPAATAATAARGGRRRPWESKLELYGNIWWNISWNVWWNVWWNLLMNISWFISNWLGYNFPTWWQGWGWGFRNWEMVENPNFNYSLVTGRISVCLPSP